MEKDNNPEFDDKFIKEKLLHPSEEGDELDSYQTYRDKDGKKGVKIIKAEDTLKKIEYVIRAIKKLEKEGKPLHIPNIFYKVRPKGMKYSDVTRLYSTLEFDFEVEWAETGDKTWSKVLKSNAYEPLLEILETYDDNKNYDQFCHALKMYIGNAHARIERNLGISKYESDSLQDFDSFKNL
ncbi:MAG: hypothetical protein KJ906_01900 [Nanoarchaeota archaeon]|nr:hypothetical protein [Nanoarchaeota archaeon]